MTKILSQLLGAAEPAFGLGLRQLEHASGGAAQDIRLTSEIMQGVQDRLKQLDLDPRDTTGRELYGALMERVREDSSIFQGLLGGDNDELNIMPRIQRFVDALPMPKQVFALKPAAAKRMLRAHPPKKAMKQLGYRSIESMLKHEQPALLLAAAHIAEGVQWHKSVRAAYKKLLPSDFESRAVQLLAPSSERWDKISRDYVLHVKQNIMSFREMGAIVLLPLPVSGIEAAPLAATLLVLQSVSDIRAASTYLKLHQVRPDFGEVVMRVARQEPMTRAQLAGSSLPWKLVHRYFASHPEAYSANLFEPHVHPDDLKWRAAEDALADLHPRFEFWRGAAHLGLLAHDNPHDKRHGQPVSVNFLDAVLNFCNKLAYEQRVVHHFRDHVWHQLMVRYMRQGSIEQTIQDQLSGELVDQNLLA